ncbi:MAG: outer membrane beta-barrel protein [Alphaproteobacteria bacterium]|nr:outer membrane beta-barrel protein [Alphaproteobacteria bacterium]
MKLKALSLLLGLAVSTAVSGTAIAADWNYGAGSIKDGATAAVPVPAPVPVPEYAARYYFRADAGVGFGDAPDSTEEGYYYGSDAVGGPYGLRSSWLNDDFDTFVTLGVGVGINIGDRFRADFTAETRSKEEVKIDGQYAYEGVTRGGQWDEVRGAVRDKTSLSGGVFLFNGYYDFKKVGGARFTPYVGGGVGFAWNELKRNHSTIENSRTCNATPCQTQFRRTDNLNTQDKTHDISFAASLMAGMAYRLSDYALLDMNYRYLFIDATDHGIHIPSRPGRTFGGDTKVSIGETHEHQIRAGIRFEVN